MDGFRWFRWVLFHLPGPSLCPTGHLWLGWWGGGWVWETHRFQAATDSTTRRLVDTSSAGEGPGLQELEAPAVGAPLRHPGASAARGRHSLRRRGSFKGEAHFGYLAVVVKTVLGSHFWGRCTTLLVGILVGIGMFTGGYGMLTHGHFGDLLASHVLSRSFGGFNTLRPPPTGSFLLPRVSSSSS